MRSWVFIGTGRAPPAAEAIAKRAKAATVLVEAKPIYGSGFCVHQSGLFVTNEHVVRRTPETITLVLNAGLKNRNLKAKVVRRDAALDLALLRVDGNDKFEPMELGSDEDLGELSELFACGFPFGTAWVDQMRYLATQGFHSPPRTPGGVKEPTRPEVYPAISINAGSVILAATKMANCTASNSTRR